MRSFRTFANKFYLFFTGCVLHSDISLFGSVRILHPGSSLKGLRDRNNSPVHSKGMFILVGFRLNFFEADTDDLIQYQTLSL